MILSVYSDNFTIFEFSYYIKHMYMKFRNLLFFVVAALSLVSCKQDPSSLLPNISGKAGEIVVVASKGDWEAEPGSALRSVLAKDFPYLPQSEPHYTLFNVPQASFKQVFQLHRNIIIVKIDESVTENKLIAQENVWANPQTVISLQAKDVLSMMKLIEDNGTKMLNIFDQAERNRVIRNCKEFEVGGLKEKVAEVFGGSPYFPTGYSIKKRTDNFMWISHETNFTNQGVFIYKYPNDNNATLTCNSIIEKRNQVLMENVPGMTQNSYMTTSKAVVPGYNWVKVGKKEFAEVRGLWDVENDFMGGPFVSHSFYSKDKSEIITVECFVYAPKYDKRNYLRQVESIIYSFTWEDEWK